MTSWLERSISQELLGKWTIIEVLSINLDVDVALVQNKDHRALSNNPTLGSLKTSCWGGGC
jgi:hypothetical protein